MTRTIAPVLIAAFLATAVIPAFAGGPVMPRQAPKGTLLVVSNLQRSDYEGLLTQLNPKFVEWVDLTTPRESIALPPAYVCMVLFLIRSEPGGLALHPSWRNEFPATEDVLARPDMIIASKLLPVKGDVDPWYVTMLIMAPTTKLLGACITEGMGLKDFPLKAPITHEVADLRQVQDLACLPSLADRAVAGVGNAAEAALYRSLIDLRAFQVVGREAMPVARHPDLSTVRQLQKLARDLKVQAVAFASIDTAETVCEEHTEFKRTNKTAASDDARKEFDAAKAKFEAQGRKVTKTGPDPDLVWAAPYQVRKYTTRVVGDVKILNGADGRALFVYKIDGSSQSQEDDEVRSPDYHWYKSDDTYSSDNRHTKEYAVRLRATDAQEIARQEVSHVGETLAVRAMLSAPGEQVLPPVEPITSTQVTARIIALEEKLIYVDLGREGGAKVGEDFSAWEEKVLKDPATGRTIETVRRRGARFKVSEVFEKVSRCEILEQDPATKLQIGGVIVAD